MDIGQRQKEICKKYGVNYHPLDLGLKLGAANDFFSEKLPLNGLRHSPVGDTCGWYLWAGKEMSTDDGYFKPIHIFHLINRRPEIIPYLALPVGWRFLIYDDYEDVWFEEKLLAS